MKKKLLLICAFVLLCVGVALIAVADWDPGDGHKMHYPQLPDPDGWDVAFYGNWGQIPLELADDWKCSETGPVSDVHFWISWFGDDIYPLNAIRVKIYSNNPVGPMGWSEPNELLWEGNFLAGQFTERPYGTGVQGWYDPWMPFYDYPNHYQYLQVNITDINDPFIQQEGEIYWLSLEVVAAGENMVGWKTSLDHFMDDGVWREPGGPWIELRDPITEESLDFSFVITTEEEPNEPNNIKWIQEPDLTSNGIDIRVDRGDGVQRIMADDFLCTTTGLITDVHLWGSWKYDEKSIINRLHLSIHSDDPIGPGGTDPNNDYSKPDILLWEKDFTPADFNESLYYQLPDGEYEWWWDITNGVLLPNGDTQVWRYDIYIDPCDAFRQEGDPCQPIIYWLDVYVETDQGFEFGWKTRRWPEHFADDAVYADNSYLPHVWQELRYPPIHQYAGQSIDMAFAITTSPNEPIFDKPLEPHTKWSQPAIEIDPTSPIPTYCGWDEQSHNKVDPPTPIRKIVADDFRCIGSMPVTSIHWWGSFFDWEWSWAHGTLPPVLPEKWWIGFWSNVPANAPPYNLPYSYPDILLHSFKVDANRVTFEEVGSDEYYGYYPYDICYQYNVDLEPNEVFWQEEFNNMTQDNIYWISIVAEYNDACEPYYKWGWKTRPWHWMDDAVTFNLDFEPGAGFVLDPYIVNPLVDPVWGESVDVSFELDTDPNYIKWEQLYTGIRDWPHYEDVESFAGGDMNLADIHLVADDWQCLSRSPVIAISWWGSYIGYHYEACSQGPFMPLPVKPDRFDLIVWTDVPAGADPCYAYSHPNEVVWTYSTNEYDEVLVGYDKHPHGAPNEPVFRYSIRLPEDAWFHQPDYNGVFWLGIQAMYDTNEPIYPWGWTNHEHVFNDDAVQMYWDSGEWKWKELYDQTGASEDMSFILFTDPNAHWRCYAGQPDEAEWVLVGEPNCWCWPRQCLGDADGYPYGKTNWWVAAPDLAILKSAWQIDNGPLTQPGICSDFDHLPYGKTNWRVAAPDLAILKSYWQIDNGPAGTCSPGNCDPTTCP